MEEKHIIYVLELENDHYYVGRTQNLDARLRQHIARRGSVWTGLHGYVRILESFPGDPFDEEKYTLIYMARHGINRVRGGTYCNLELTQEQYLSALRSIRGSLGTCLACGLGHFIRECTTRICYRCGRLYHTHEECTAVDNIHSWPLNGCYRCGRLDHWAWRCNRTRDIYGRMLEPNPVIRFVRGLFEL